MARTIVITGASAGVGRAAARRFAVAGDRVALVARDPARLEVAAGEVRELGGVALACPADVADATAVEAVADRVERSLGPIDIWVNVAMATVFGRFLDIAPEDYRRATEVTYLGFVHGTQAALRRMLPRDRGTVVQTGSALAYRSIPLQSAYCGAKHAIVGFTDSLRSELLHDGSRVRLTVVHLPAVNTPQFDWARNRLACRPRPMAPVYQPEVAAEALFRAARHPRREYWLAWSTVKAIAGQRLAPGLADRILADSAVAGQQDDEPADRQAGDNLYAPLPGNWAAHGRFDDEARNRTDGGWLLRPGGGAALALGLIGLGVAGLLLAAGRGYGSTSGMRGHGWLHGR